jgi:hypothetical protein
VAGDDPMIDDVLIWKFVAEHCTRANPTPGILDRDCAQRGADCTRSWISMQA